MTNSGVLSLLVQKWPRIQLFERRKKNLCQKYTPHQQACFSAYKIFKNRFNRRNSLSNISINNTCAAGCTNALRHLSSLCENCLFFSENDYCYPGCAVAPFNLWKYYIEKWRSMLNRY